MIIRHSRRRVLGYGAAGAVALGMPSIARAQGQVVRIGLPTKTYYPTIIAETALRQKLFEKEGIKAELTIYRGGAEGYEAMAAGAADVILNSASSVAAGIKKGVMAKNVAGAALGYYGWHLVVKTDSKVQDPKELVEIDRANHLFEGQASEVGDALEELLTDFSCGKQ